MKAHTHALTTTARRDGDSYVISSTKYWISGPDQADAILVVYSASFGRSEPILEGRGITRLNIAENIKPQGNASLGHQRQHRRRQLEPRPRTQH